MYGVGGAPPERGIVRWGERFTTVDYPPIALYELAIAGTFYSIATPSFRDTPWLSATMKALPLAAELALAFVLWRAMRRVRGNAAAAWAVVAFWANPAMILAGSVLGYLDALMALPAVAAIVAASSGSAVGAGALIAIACLTKAQGVFIVPVVGLAAWQTRGARGVGFTAAGAAIAGTLAVAPFAFAGAWRNLLRGVGSLLRHDMLSADAANLWWLVTYVMRAIYAVHDLGVWGAWTMTVRILGISRVVALGYPNPRPAAAAALLAAACWGVWTCRRSRDLAVLLACAAFVVHAYFVLGVQVHENHLYLAVPLLAGAAAVLPDLRPVFYGVSAVFALNLWLFFGLGRGLAPPSRNITVIDATVLLAVANCALLALHAVRIARVSARPACENTYRCDPASPVESG